MAKKKFYVVWEGHKKGIFTSWDVCKKQIDNFKGAKYKAFVSKNEAEEAFKRKYEDYKGKGTKKVQLSAEELKKYGKPIFPSLSVDAACAGNPGKMEYRGVDSETKRQLFIQGPFEKGTNNIGEFLALVHGLGYLKQKNLNFPIPSSNSVKNGKEGVSEKVQDYLFDLVSMMDSHLEKGDVIIIGLGGDFKKSRLASLSAALTLI